MEIADNNKMEKTDLVTYSKFKITSAETDMEARLRPGALINLLIQSASQSADSLGFGYSELREHNLIWVLSRFSVKIFKELKWNDTIEIETWPKDITGLLYLRDFVARDENGEVVAMASSAWLAIDLERKRPTKIEGEFSDIFVSLKEKYAYPDPPEKLLPVESGTKFTVVSTYFDIDLNKHVTTTRYFDWMMDTFSPDFHKDHYPQLLSINFVKETLPGSQLNIFRKKNSDSEYVFEGVNTGLIKTSFRGKIVF